MDKPIYRTPYNMGGLISEGQFKALRNLPLRAAAERERIMREAALQRHEFSNRFPPKIMALFAEAGKERELVAS